MIPYPFRPCATDPVWLAIAAREIGQREVSGVGDNPRIVEYFTATDYGVSHDAVPWCSAFANWVMRTAGYQRTKSAAAVSWLRYGMGADSTQIRGAIVVLCRRDAAPDPATGSPTGNHVGFLLDATPAYVEVLGGNQGDAVQISRFPRPSYRVRAVRWPRTCDRITTPAPASSSRPA